MEQIFDKCGLLKDEEIRERFEGKVSGLVLLICVAKNCDYFKQWCN